jgi:hypothetical protein
MLVIGTPAGRRARAFGELYPTCEIDGVEIDPKVTEVGRRYFGLGDNPRLHVVTADGRPYLAGRTSATTSSPSTPTTSRTSRSISPTEEFFRLVRDHLAPGGAVALNVAAVPGDERLSDRARHDDADAVPVGLALAGARVQPAPPRLPEAVSQAELRESRSPRSAPPPSRSSPISRAASPMSRTGEPLTDDRAPVEWLTDRMILGYAAHGGELEQDLLPTAPGRELAEAGGRLPEGRPSRRFRARARELARSARGRARGRSGHGRARRPRVDGALRLAHSAAQLQPDSPVLEDALELFARQAQPRSGSTST